MSSFAYDSMLEDLARARLDFSADKFFVILVGPEYRPSQRAHSRRSDVTDEIAGDGYTKGGKPVAVSLSKSSESDRVDISLGAVEWPKSTIKARGAVYFKRRGGLESEDELIAFDDFDSVVMSLNGRFALSESVIRIQNIASQSVVVG